MTIVFVDPDSPASRAGLKPQDTILRVNDLAVRSLEPERVKQLTALAVREWLLSEAHAAAAGGSHRRLSLGR